MEPTNDRRRQLSQPLLHEDVDSQLIKERNEDVYALSSDLMQLRYRYSQHYLPRDLSLSYSSSSIAVIPSPSLFLIPSYYVPSTTSYTLCLPYHIIPALLPKPCVHAHAFHPVLCTSCVPAYTSASCAHSASTMCYDRPPFPIPHPPSPIPHPSCLMPHAPCPCPCPCTCPCILVLLDTLSYLCLSLAHHDPHCRPSNTSHAPLPSVYFIVSLLSLRLLALLSSSRPHIGIQGSNGRSELTDYRAASSFGRCTHTSRTLEYTCWGGKERTQKGMNSSLSHSLLFQIWIASLHVVFVLYLLLVHRPIYSILNLFPIMANRSASNRGAIFVFFSDRSLFVPLLDNTNVIPQARRYQNSARRKLCVLALIMLGVLAVVVFIILKVVKVL